MPIHASPTLLVNEYNGFSTVISQTSPLPEHLRHVTMVPTLGGGSLVEGDTHRSQAGAVLARFRLRNCWPHSLEV